MIRLHAAYTFILGTIERRTPSLLERVSAIQTVRKDRFLLTTVLVATTTGRVP